MIEIHELTTEKDRSGGFRNLMVTRDDTDSRCLVSIAAVRSENISFTGDDPSYITTGNIEDNHTLGLILLRLASELLLHPHTVNLPTAEIISPNEPVPYEIPNCHED